MCMRECTATRQGELLETHSLLRYEHKTRPIPLCSGDRKGLLNFINHSFSWIVRHQLEEAPTHETPVLMAQRYCDELNQESGKRTVEQSVSVWSAHNKAIERVRKRFDMVMNAKSLSLAWNFRLVCMVDDQNSNYAKETSRRVSSISPFTISHSP